MLQSQRLSHACLSISNLYSETANGSLNQLSFYLIVPLPHGITGGNLELIHAKISTLEEMYLLDKNQCLRTLMIHNNFSNRMALCWRLVHSNFCPYQLSMVG